MSTRVRAQCNRVFLTVLLAFVLPAIAIAEWCRAGAGRRLAVRVIHAQSAVTGIRFIAHVEPDARASVPAVLVANHRSFLDIPAVLVVRPDVRFLAAAGLFRIPLLGTAMRALGSIPIERDNREQSHRQVDALATQREHDLLVFAEGGISRNGLGPFRSGAFRIAIASGLPIIPVAISGSNRVLGHGARLRAKPGTVTVEVGRPISTSGLTVDARHALRDATRDAVHSSLARLDST